MIGDRLARGLAPASGTVHAARPRQTQPFLRTLIELVTVAGLAGSRRCPSGAPGRLGLCGATMAPPSFRRATELARERVDK